MSAFTGPLVVELLSAQSGHARLLQPLVWEVEAKGSGLTITVPAGFVSDGVTTPRWLWWLVPPWGHGATRAAILHDWMLAAARRHGAPPEWHALRRAADAEFRAALAACGIDPWLALAMWAGVRLKARSDEVCLRLRGLAKC